jgi:hypothetical protein
MNNRPPFRIELLVPPDRRERRLQDLVSSLAQARDRRQDLDVRYDADTLGR